MAPKASSSGTRHRARARNFVRIRKLNDPTFSTPPLWLARQAEALHERGPRPLGEILFEMICEWGPDFEAEPRAALGRYNRIPLNTYAALGADQFPMPPLTLIKGARR